ncbi:MAG: ABC transporter permease subunit [Pyrobaculum sp.]
MRRVINYLGLSMFVALALMGVAPLFLIIYDIYSRGIPAIIELGGWSFFIDIPPSPFVDKGGIGPQLVGSLYMTAIGALIGFAIGFPLGVYVGEFRRDLFANVSRGAVNMLVEFPTITIGLFVFTLLGLVRQDINPVLEKIGDAAAKWFGDWVWYFIGPLDYYNAYAGAVALALIMIPYVALFTASAYSTVEPQLREAAYAVSGREYNAVFVVLRKVVARAILTAALLGTAKIAGETAPLIFTAFGNNYYGEFTKPTAAVPLWIYYASQTPYESLIISAYGAAAVLLTIILALFIIARAVGRLI